ncbi:MAG: hypothetical protein WA152_00550 [Microgenomates group bacterium]
MRTKRIFCTVRSGFTNIPVKFNEYGVTHVKLKSPCEGCHVRSKAEGIEQAIKIVDEYLINTETVALDVTIRDVDGCPTPLPSELKQSDKIVISCTYEIAHGAERSG